MHHWAFTTRAEQRATGQPVTAYLWIPDRHDVSAGARWHAATVWYHRWLAAKRAMPTGFPFACISHNEEYGLPGDPKGGYNTSAGWFGMSAGPPGSYVSPGPEMAARYGNSWTDIPLLAQEQIVLAVYHTFGPTAWSTHGDCGI